ncbi:MAG: hypothetical protein QNJ55_22015 [Xenococcus sp. MO_188.B8]|nr:hypothetical protein [Xenococcus sp. MO_188.B8]
MDNRFENCLRMEFETKQVTRTQFDLIASIRFGIEQVSIHYGKAQFAIKKGKLKVNLVNGEVPLKNIKLYKILETKEEIKSQQGVTQEDNTGVNLGWKNPGIYAGSKKTKQNGQEYIVKEYLVKTKGGLSDPVWIFEATANNDILEGLLQQTSLATVNVTGNPCVSLITFEVENTEDICLLNGDTFLRKNVDKKKMLVIERKIVRRFLDELLQEKTYLSRVKLVYG